MKGIKCKNCRHPLLPENIRYKMNLKGKKGKLAIITRTTSTLVTYQCPECMKHTVVRGSFTPPDTPPENPENPENPKKKN